jgi:hypothetical protein
VVLNDVGGEKGLLYPIVVGIGTEDEVHKLSE